MLLFIEERRREIEKEEIEKEEFQQDFYFITLEDDYVDYLVDNR